MKRLKKLNPFRDKLSEKTVAELKIAEGKLMQKIEETSAELNKQQDELKTIRNLITEKTASQ